MTTAISRDDVLHLAKLSQLQLDETEVTSLQHELGDILEHVQLLGELDTTGVEPTYQVTDRENVYRTDEVATHTVGRDQLLERAPDHDQGQFKVPKVL